jgi:hypothetical protein
MRSQLILVAKIVFCGSGVPLFCMANYTPINPGAFFCHENAPTELIFRYSSENKANAAHDYSVRDYTGTVIIKDKATVDAGGIIHIPVDLPGGYHEIVFDATGEEQATGIWTLPSKPPPPDGFMSMDMALSWLVQPELRTSLIDNLQYSIGTGGLARERFKWAEINPEEGRWDWETNRHNDSVRQLYKKAQIPVLEVFHDAPT